jgi:hypothetical protein
MFPVPLMIRFFVKPDATRGYTYTVSADDRKKHRTKDNTRQTAAHEAAVACPCTMYIDKVDESTLLSACG